MPGGQGAGRQWQPRRAPGLTAGRRWLGGEEARERERELPGALRLRPCLRPRRGRGRAPRPGLRAGDAGDGAAPPRVRFFAPPG